MVKTVSNYKESGRRRLTEIDITDETQVTKIARPKPSKPKVTKRARHVKHPHPVEKREKLTNLDTASLEHTPRIARAVRKVPAYEFPAEISKGLNLDPSLETDYRTVFTPEGSHITDNPIVQSQPPPNLPKEPTTSYDAEDGNVDFCLVCKKSGNVICCDKCPRSFHPNCLQVNQTELPDRWVCPRCNEDSTAQEEDTVTGNDRYDKIIEIYTGAESKKIDDEKFCNHIARIILITKLMDVIQRLKEYDFGYIFSEPVSIKDVPDYRNIVKHPMDLGTIMTNISRGVYKTKVESLPKSDTSNCMPMDLIILEILKDLELVWHNCLLYNREGEKMIKNQFKFLFDYNTIKRHYLFSTGTSYYKMAEVMRQKYNIMRRINIDNELDSFISQKLGEYTSECRQSRLEHANQNVKSSKPWVPYCKNNVIVPIVVNRGIRKAVAVFDPSTNMIVKQYSSLASAVIAVDFLNKKLKFDCEINTTSHQLVKAIINKSAMDPSLLIFGYRWICVDNLRNGNFIVSENIQKTIIKKVSTASNATLAEFDSVEKAHVDWKGDKAKTATSNAENEDSIEYFTKQFLDGSETIDGITWKRVIDDEDNYASTDNIVVKREIEEDNAAPPPLEDNRTGENVEKEDGTLV